MGSRMKDLYDFPESIDEQDIYIQDLAEQCAVLAGRVQEMMESLPEEKRQLLEAYIEAMDELEFQSVKKAMRFGRKMGAAQNKSII